MHLIEALWWQRADITHRKSCSWAARMGFWIAALTNDEREAARGNCRPVLSKINHCTALLPSKHVISNAEFSLITATCCFLVVVPSGAMSCLSQRSGE